MTGAPPRRPGIVHLGVGSFARAHLAWYTQHAGPDPDGTRWGITAFTGRSRDAADALTAHGCWYTLVTRSAEGDHAETIDSILAAHSFTDAPAWLAALASPTTAVVTLTVTESGYRPESGVAARLADGLRARVGADAGPLTIMSLDNLTDNGAVLAAAVRHSAREDRELLAWIDEHVTFPSSMVDRITPATTDDDISAVSALDGAVADDRIPVVTEPFTEWVITDDFAASRPAWETAGAHVVDDVRPYEQRKLWLLNGAHSLLAYLGLLLGHTTIAEAMADPRCRAVVEQLWDEAAAELALPAEQVTSARAALAERFSNPRIRHTLRQIAADGSKKLPVRIVDVVRRRLARDPTAHLGDGAAMVIAAWWLHVVAQPELVNDPDAPGPDADAHEVLAALGPDLDTESARVAITDAAARIRAMIPPDGEDAVTTPQGAPA
jgi:fructuronate reductase